MNPDWPKRTVDGEIEVTMIIVTWNGREYLERHLPSLMAAIRCARVPCETLIVDNGSTDGTVAWLRTQYPEVRVLALKRNEGFAKGNNRGALEARGRILVFLNNDVQIEVGFLNPLLESLRASDVFAVGAHLNSLSGKQHETGLTRGRFHRGLFTVEHARAIPERAAPCLYPSAAAIAVDRDKFLSLGGFSELFEPFYWEDADLGYRAWKRGWRVLFEPRSLAYHQRRGTVGRYSPGFIERVFERNRWLFTWKNLHDRRLWYRHMAWLPLRLLGDLLRGRWNAVMSLAWAVGRLPHVRRTRAEERRSLQRSDAAVLRLACDPLAYQVAYPPPTTPHREGRLKLLWVCPYLPREGMHGGGARMFQLIRRLAQRHEVWVISFATPEEQAAVQSLRDICHHVDVVPRASAPPHDPWSPEPWCVQEFRHPIMRALIQTRLLEESFDIAQFEYLSMAQYAPQAYVGATVLTEHQLQGFARWGELRSAAWWRMPYVAGSALKGIAYELPACRRFDGVITLTPEEARRLQPFIPETPLAVLPMGVDCAALQRTGVARRPSDLLYVGYYAHAPNTDAVLWFAKTMWPIIQRRRPQTTWTIVGAHPPDAILALSRQPGIQVIGHVDDARPYLAGCSVFIMPIRTGGGMRAKLMEAWAMECAVVSTSLGCEGSRARHGVHAVIVNRPDDFSAEVLRLLDQAAVRQLLGEAGRRHAEEHFNWEALVRGHEAFYDTLLQRKGRQTRSADAVDETVGALVGDPDP